jgi:hypothetical protein
VTSEPQHLTNLAAAESDVLAADADRGRDVALADVEARA